MLKSVFGLETTFNDMVRLLEAVWSDWFLVPGQSGADSGSASALCQTESWCCDFCDCATVESSASV